MSMKENGIFDSKPDKQGLPLNGGNDHGKTTLRPKGKSKQSGKPGIPAGVPSRPKS